MSPGPARRFDALLDECMDVLASIEARVASRFGDPTGAVELGDVGDAARLLRALEDAARVARADAGGPPSSLSTACPDCGSAEVGLAQVVPGVALGHFVGALFELAGETELDWGGALAVRRGGGLVLVCDGCGSRWANPLAVVDVSLNGDPRLPSTTGAFSRRIRRSDARRSATLKPDTCQTSDPGARWPLGSYPIEPPR